MTRSRNKTGLDCQLFHSNGCRWHVWMMNDAGATEVPRLLGAGANVDRGVVSFLYFLCMP